MIAFEVHVNGKKKCTAGIVGPAVLTAVVTWAFAVQSNGAFVEKS